jgi:hypothetical protein
VDAILSAYAVEKTARSLLRRYGALPRGEPPRHQTPSAPAPPDTHCALTASSGAAPPGWEALLGGGPGAGALVGSEEALEDSLVAFYQTHNPAKVCTRCPRRWPAPFPTHTPARLWSDCCWRWRCTGNNTACARFIARDCRLCAPLPGYCWCPLLLLRHRCCCSLSAARCLLLAVCCSPTSVSPEQLHPNCTPTAPQLHHRAGPRARAPPARSPLLGRRPR